MVLITDTRICSTEEASEEVFMLYLCYGKEVFLKKHCRFPTEEEMVRMWNGGIYKGYKYNQTKSLLPKVFRC